jgi:hypothetical protein
MWPSVVTCTCKTKEERERLGGRERERERERERDNQNKQKTSDAVFHKHSAGEIGRRADTNMTSPVICSHVVHLANPTHHEAFTKPKQTLNMISSAPPAHPQPWLGQHGVSNGSGRSWQEGSTDLVGTIFV